MINVLEDRRERERGPRGVQDSLSQRSWEPGVSPNSPWATGLVERVL